MKLTTSFLFLSVFSTLAFADETRTYPDIYPFKPKELKEITDEVARMTEDKDFIKNINQLDKMRSVELNQFGKRPWGSTYWPLNKGTVADPYTGISGVDWFHLRDEMSWSHNYAQFESRKEDYLPKIVNGELSEEELAVLAPSEKYDLLLGDENFDLTNRLWAYAKAWGEDKKHSFISSIRWDLGQKLYNDPNVNFENYVLKDQNEHMALWEGICHGWSTAAGQVPRPKHAFEIALDGKNAGKKLKIYPDDIKGLASLFWANSVAQDTVLMHGLRCNEKFPKKDQWGRFYDSEPDRISKKLEERCVGIHPAIWHMSLINLIGKQQRSFIVERKIKAAVDNHPMAGYEIAYFNPKSGDDGSLSSSTVARSDYEKDPFASARNPKAVKIVGVALTMKYVDWSRPTRAETDSPSDDKIEEKEMLYDLELDKDNNVVGGQWRTYKRGRAFFGGLDMFGDRNQPDFFWVVPKNTLNESFMQEMTGLDKWENLKSVPPKTWKQAAWNSHSFMYKTFVNEEDVAKNIENGTVCKMEHVKTGEYKEVPCEFKTNKPQPLSNLLFKLVKLAQ